MRAGKKIYLDHNATTPTDKRVVEAMLPYFTEKFGNASSDHVFGWDGEEAVEHSREQLARLLNIRPAEITFTSGATEATNLALLGFCERNKANGKHIISCKTEHKAVLDILNALEHRGCEVTYLDVDSDGNIDPEELESSITSETLLVCLMLANNETGLIHPIKKIAGIVHSSGAKLMCDITQAVGKIPLNLEELDVDIAVFSSHKFYGPKGVGALYLNKRNRVNIEPVFFGGGQEKNLRPGTLNVPGIVGFGKAAELALAEIEGEMKRIKALRDKLENSLQEIEGLKINSQDSERLPNTVNFSVEHIDGTRLIRKLNRLAISRGSACSSNLVKPSHVLKAMGLSDELALASVRISLGRNTTEEEIEIAAAEIKSAVSQLKITAV